MGPKDLDGNHFYQSVYKEDTKFVNLWGFDSGDSVCEKNIYWSGCIP